MAEQLQQLILDTLDTQSTLPDTRTLTIPGQSSQTTSHDAQITILGALNSLLSREASFLYFYRDPLLNEKADDNIRNARNFVACAYTRGIPDRA